MKLNDIQLFMLKEEADESFDRMAYQAAEVKYTQYLQQRPQDADVRYLRGITRRCVGNINGALEDFNTLLVLNNRNINALIGRANTYWLREQRDQARIDFQAVLAIQPNHLAATESLQRMQVEETHQQLEETSQQLQQQLRF